MRRFAIGLSSGAAILLAGCGDRAVNGLEAQHHGGRFVGIGIYAPHTLWQRMTGVPRPANAQAATLEDDSQIIVVVDSQTGEIRQCGNLSGHCIRMNPWSGGPAPVSLSAHAADLEREAEANAPVDLNAAANEAGAAPAPRARPDRQ
ncbi:MAG TPA: hypothetical protein VIT38_04825 [Allosphingosinicella sp.]